MTVRERFTGEEWTLVTHAPFDAFFFASMADGKLEEGEVAAFTETIARARDLIDPLHREIALEYAEGGERRVAEELLFQGAETADDMHSRMLRTKQILQDKLTTAEYQSFVASLFKNAVVIASASPHKKHFWSKKDQPITEAEARALVMLATIWDVDLSFIQGVKGL